MVDADPKGVDVGVSTLYWQDSKDRELLSLGCVVAFAGQHLQIGVGHVDFDFAKFSVMRRVRRIVAERVLAAELFGNLIEGFGQVLFGIDRNRATAGLFGGLVRHAAIPE